MLLQLAHWYSAFTVLLELEWTANDRMGKGESALEFTGDVRDAVERLAASLAC